MTNEQSNEEKLLKSDSIQKESAEYISSSVEDDKNLGKSSTSPSQEPDDDSDDSLIADILPPEILEALPDGARKHISSSLSFMALRGGSLHSSPIAKKIDTNHITQIIENQDKESQREFEKSKISEHTKRWGMGAILSLVVVVFVYAGVTKDKDLSEKVVLAGISAIGGFGAGYAFAKEK
jgi:hypothetical protein